MIDNILANKSDNCATCSPFNMLPTFSDSTNLRNHFHQMSPLIPVEFLGKFENSREKMGQIVVLVRLSNKLKCS